MDDFTELIVELESVLDELRMTNAVSSTKLDEMIEAAKNVRAEIETNEAKITIYEKFLETLRGHKQDS